MSTTTTNYALVKPALTDSPDITAINPNWDTIDSKIKIMENHTGNSTNPHSVTKSQVGLGNVDNTADASKNVLSASKLTTARTLSYTGDATGSGTFDGSGNLATTLILANSGVAANTYKSVTVDAKGRVTGGSNPTTLAGHGITDGVINSIISGVSLNTMTTSGTYLVGGGCTNIPSGMGMGNLLVCRGYGGGDTLFQIVTDQTSGAMYKRVCNSIMEEIWQNWIRIDNSPDTEEGVFTPYMTVNGNQVYSASKNGYYRRIGKVVYFELGVSREFNSGIGKIRVLGLPYTALYTGVDYEATTVNMYGYCITLIFGISCEKIGCHIVNGTNYIKFDDITGNGIIEIVPTNDEEGYLLISGSYIIA